MNFYQDYLRLYNMGMNGVDLTQLQLAIETIKATAKNDKNIFVGGNGGSAAISNHLCCDFIKGAEHPNFKHLKTFSLSCNTPLITAISNDIGYKESLSYQLDHLMREGDLVILISSSGNSENIARACSSAKKHSNMVIGMTGFNGGILKEMADIKLHVPIDNYGVVEDCHQSLMHIMSQFIARERILNVGI